MLLENKALIYCILGSHNEVLMPLSGLKIGEQPDSACPENSRLLPWNK
jgi:hypothetical protein